MLYYAKHYIKAGIRYLNKTKTIAKKYAK
jgi:hypothetical protein